MEPSIRLFRKYIVRQLDGTLDASRITSFDCYRDWLETRKNPALMPERAFRKALSCHITGSDGRTPFTQDEEVAILKVVRRKERWACFRNSDVTIGENGFRTKGFHEKVILGETPERLPKKRAKTIPATRLPPDIVSAKRERSSSAEDDVSDHSSNSWESSTDSEASQEMAVVNMMTDASLPPDLANWYQRCRSAATTFGGDVPFTECFRKFLKVLEKFQERCGDEWRAYSFKFTRFLLYSWGYIQAPRMEDARRLIEETSASHPDEYVLIYDFMQEDWTRRIVLQNDLSKQYFGNISQDHGPYIGPKFVKDDTVIGIRAYTYAFYVPSQDCAVQWRLKCFGSVHVCDSVLRVDPQSGLLIERGRIASSKKPKQSEEFETTDQ